MKDRNEGRKKGEQSMMEYKKGKSPEPKKRRRIN